MQIKSEFIAPDASGYSCVVLVRGVMFVISYVNNKLSVGLGPYKRAPNYPKWYYNHVLTWAKKRVAELPDSFFQAHKELYAD